MPTEIRDNLSLSKHYEGVDSFRVVGIYGVVLFHFYNECICGPNASVDRLIRLRDCTFPFIILTSFFFFVRSIWNNPERDFLHFATVRFKRIEMPLLIWTFIYWGVWGAFRPLIGGEPITRPSATLLLSGYMHLWFLQFIFLGSIILFPIVRFLTPIKHYRWQIATSCVLVALSHIIWFRPFFDHFVETGWIAQADLSLRVFATNVNRFFPYVPAAMVIALYADKINALYKHQAFRMLSLLIVALALSAHVGINSLRFTRGIYSLAVFVAVLQPWPASLVNLLRPIAVYSYPIYILHFLLSRILASIFRRAQIDFTTGRILIGSIIVFGLSLLLAVVIRKLFPWDWFLPLIPIDRRKQDSRMTSQVRYSQS